MTDLPDDIARRLPDGDRIRERIRDRDDATKPDDGVGGADGASLKSGSVIGAGRDASYKIEDIQGAPHKGGTPEDLGVSRNEIVDSDATAYKVERIADVREAGDKVVDHKADDFDINQFGVKSALPDPLVDDIAAAPAGEGAGFKVEVAATDSKFGEGAAGYTERDVSHKGDPPERVGAGEADDTQADAGGVAAPDPVLQPLDVTDPIGDDLVSMGDDARLDASTPDAAPSVADLDADLDGM